MGTRGLVVVVVAVVVWMLARKKNPRRLLAVGMRVLLGQLRRVLSEVRWLAGEKAQW